jgi:hypothetical protein
MTPFSALYYSGKTAHVQRVLIGVDRVDGLDILSVTGESRTQCYPIAAMTAEPPVGHARRFLLLPDGGTFEYEVDAVGEAWLRLRYPGHGRRSSHSTAGRSSPQRLWCCWSERWARGSTADIPVDAAADQ